MHDRPGSTSLECSGPLAILFLHESTPHPPATLTCSLDSWGKRFQIPIPPTTCLWGEYNQPGHTLTSNAAGVHPCVNRQHRQGASTGNIARVHECVNRQHCRRDTPLRHLAILQYTTSLYAGCHANTRAYRSSGSSLWAHHLYVGAYSTTVQVPFLTDQHQDSTIGPSAPHA